MKVSFIVPIYNVEKYLNECVNSIISQSYKDIEVILVDDGSPDNCPQICDEWAGVDSRIKVIHKPNGGLSDARNAGAEVATGDYIIFVDSDDFWVFKNALTTLMKTVAKYPDCDFVGFNCSYFYSDNQTYKRWVQYDDILSVPMDKNQVVCSLVSSGTMPMSACLKVISRQLYQSNNLHFIKGIRSEDIPWFIDLLDCSKQSVFVNQYIYAYRQNVAGSITATGGEKSFNDLLNIVKNEVGKIDSRTFSQEAKDYLLSFLAYEFCILLAMVSKIPQAKAKRKELLQYKWLLKYTHNPKVKKVALVNKWFGIRITEMLLKMYLRHVH